MKTQNINKYPTGTSILKITIKIKDILPHTLDQFVVVPIKKANGNLTFICKLGIFADGVSSNSDTYNMRDISGHLIIKQDFKHLSRLQVSQDKKILPSI